MVVILQEYFESTSSRCCSTGVLPPCCVWLWRRHSLKSTVCYPLLHWYIVTLLCRCSFKPTVCYCSIDALPPCCLRLWCRCCFKPTISRHCSVHVLPTCYVQLYYGGYLFSQLVLYARQPQRIISGLKETFIKRYTVERTNKAEIRPEEHSEKAESCWEDL